MGIALLMVIVTTRAESDLWEEDDTEVLVRTVRGTKERGIFRNRIPRSICNSQAKAPKIGCSRKGSIERGRKKTTDTKARYRESIAPADRTDEKSPFCLCWPALFSSFELPLAYGPGNTIEISSDVRAPFHCRLRLFGLRNLFGPGSSFRATDRGENSFFRLLSRWNESRKERGR